MHLLGGWVRGCGPRTLARWRLLWPWQRQPAISVGKTRATTSPEGVGTEGVTMPTAVRDESPEVEDVLVAAGEHR
jgi:hypothetical protein